ncbi:MAG: RnfABCDGE type electron transport complex subunit B [Desulfovibrionales bacterium]|nr:RnfABCDGE type electron transport complex subunit B [Desulfovibrionales bacterium]
MGPTITAIVAMGALGLGLSVVLGVAAKVFYIYVDPRIGAVTDVLPGANCGGCGYAGCSDCAAAIVEGKAPVNACKAGGAGTAAAVAQVLGVSAAVGEREVARIFCKGDSAKAERKFKYMGINDCRAAMLVSSGDKSCSYGCLGLGTCVANCPFGALSMGEDGLPKVDDEKCTACGTCVKVCPRHIPKVVPVSQKAASLCSSHDVGKLVKEICDAGCLGCGLCKKACPEKAIEIVKFLSVVDAKKCTGCGACFEKCPTGIIQSLVFTVV